MFGRSNVRYDLVPNVLSACYNYHVDHKMTNSLNVGGRKNCDLNRETGRQVYLCSFLLFLMSRL